MLLGQEPGRRHLAFSAPGDPIAPPLAPSSPRLSAKGRWGVFQHFLACFCRDSSIPLLRLENVVAATTPQLQTKPALWPCTEPRGRCCPALDPHSATAGDFSLTPRREHLPTLHLERIAYLLQVLWADHQRQKGQGHLRCPTPYSALASPQGCSVPSAGASLCSSGHPG